jgi:hypothetical protein
LKEKEIPFRMSLVQKRSEIDMLLTSYDIVWSYFGIISNLHNLWYAMKIKPQPKKHPL